MYKLSGALGLAAILLTAAPAVAQEKGQVGLAMGYPGSIGVIFHASDTLAIRPDVTFSTSSSTTTYSTNSTTNDNTSYGVGVSALFYAGKWDNLRAYFSPRFGYSRGTTDYASPSASGTSSTTSNYAVSGSFGAQYSLARRFAVFGEVGLAYNHQTADSIYNSQIYTNPSSSSSANAWSTRTAVGGIFYFK